MSKIRFNAIHYAEDTRGNRHDISEILFKLPFSTITLTLIPREEIISRKSKDRQCNCQKNRGTNNDTQNTT